jgi:hypothetical protein
VAHDGQVAAQLGCLVGAVAGGGSRSDDRDGVAGELTQVVRSADPQADGFAAAFVEGAGVAECAELGGPFGVAGDDEADAAGGGLLKHLGGVDAAELLGEREAPVGLDVARGLEVVADLAGAELADQAGDAEVSGLDGPAEGDAGEPVNVVDVGAGGAHARPPHSRSRSGSWMTSRRLSGA